MTRRQLREETFKMLFMRDFHDAKEMPEMIENFITISDELSDESNAADRAYVEEKLDDLVARTVELDASINAAAEGWTTERMNKVDLTLLRLALYEMRIEGLDAGIAINEAVELAKEYGEERSPAFVNGILGKLA